MLSAAADTDATAAVLLPRSQATPPTQIRPLMLLFDLFFSFLFVCLPPHLSCSPFFFSCNPIRCHVTFQELSWENRLPTTHTQQSHSQQGSTSHVPFDTSFLRDMTSHLHSARASANRKERRVPAVPCEKQS